MSVITIRDFDRTSLDSLVDFARSLKEDDSEYKNKFSDKLLASLFFEDSTRTRTSHELAARKLGMEVIGFAGTEGTSVKKSEPLIDTLRMFEGYGTDAFVIRHHLEGAARYAADIFDVPVINAGDGSNGHPTQALMDTMTMIEAQGRLDGSKVAIVGDLKYGRVPHSGLQALAHYDVDVTLVSPRSLAMPKHFIFDYRKQTGREIHVTSDLNDILGNVDIIMMLRIQRERFPAGPEGDFEYQRVSQVYRLTADMLTDEKVLHPLPMNKDAIEVDWAVRNMPNAWFYKQAANGLFMREGLFIKLLTGELSAGEPAQQYEASWHTLPPGNKKRDGDHVYRLDNGTLIDHIEPGQREMLLKLFGFSSYKDNPIIYVGNLESSKYGSKDVLGIAGRELSTEEISRLALVTKGATVNIVRDKRVVKKGRIVLPSIIEDLIECQNTKCVSYPDHNEFAPSKFYVENRDPLLVRCHYCEVPSGRDGIVLQ
tara:strand:- start:744 stop:2192 length:1449 start_codon:yes stop_codon:yes gene_type:complete